MPEGEIVVLVTVGNGEEAEVIAHSLVGERLAACVQMLGPVRSIYRWHEAVHDEEEWLLVIKSRADLFEQIEAWVRALHSYDTPEVIALPVSAGSQPYLEWLRRSVGPVGQVGPV